MKKEYDFITKFPPLGHIEHHFNKYPNQPWIKNKNEMKKYIVENFEGKFLGESLDFDDNFIIHDDMSVSNIGKESIINFKSNGLLKVQFRICKGFKFERDINSNYEFFSFIGSPYVSDYLMADSENIKSFYGISTSLKKIDIYRSGCIDFKGMPLFNNDVEFSLFESPIKSWKGFTSCGKLYWWQDRWCDKTSMDLLLSAPLNIKEIVVSNRFKNECCKYEEVLLGISKIDMVWLRNEQLRLRLKVVNDEIDGEILDINEHEHEYEKETKKRKI